MPCSRLNKCYATAIAILGLTFAASHAQAQATKAVFFASGPNAGAGASDLWITDGTAAGTVQIPVADIASFGLVSNGSGGPDFTFLNGKALFTGRDNVGRTGLWATDGTENGTSELVIPGVPTCGIFCDLDSIPDFTILGGNILFKGEDAATGHTNLWVTNGTVAGTTELTVPGAGSGGLFNDNDPDFTVLGDKALFIAEEALWTTDGTGNGTTQINASGLNFFIDNPDPTVFGNVVIFAGADNNDNVNPWISDGTVAGTVEILAQGASTGQFVSDVKPEFTVLGSKVLFSGKDANNHQTLWVTDGTSAGTIELTPPGAFAGGFFGGPITTNIEPNFTVLGDMVVFAGYDNLGIPSLWVTDGTSAGTVELTVSGASPSGLFSSGFAFNESFGPNFTVLGNKAIFAGLDTNNHLNLWVTNGTSAGTTELIVPAADSNGLVSQSSINGTGHFAVLGSKVLFMGNDNQDNFNELWATDGTVAGTIPLGPFNPSDLTPLVQVFNGPLPSSLASAVAPGSRSVEVPGPATVFATMVNTSGSPLTNCQISLPASAPAGLALSYQATNPATNALTGQPNTPVSIAANGIQTFVLSFSSKTPLTDPGQAVTYACSESMPAPPVLGVNSVDLLFSATPIPDIIALAATATNDLTVHLSNDIGAFSVASIDVGAGGSLTVGTDTGGATLPVSVSVCQTTATGQCMASPAASVPITFAADSAPTFSIFASASAPIAFAPGTSRVFVRFKDGNGVSHGATSVAITTN